MESFLDFQGSPYQKESKYNEKGKSKGRIVSICFLVHIFNSPKKRTKKFDSTTMVPIVELFLFVFLEELKTPKIYFEIN